MNHYPHHIGDFNNATRHSTVVERAFYRELIELYYFTEKPIPAGDFEWLAKRCLAKSDDEKAALKAVLDEFFKLDDGVYRHNRCDAEILIYKDKIEKAQKAGKMSALSRAKQTLNTRSTPVQPTKNQEPLTKNQEPRTNKELKPNGASAKALLPEDTEITITLNDKTEYPVSKVLVAELEGLYPAVDVPQTLREIRAWCITNPHKRKTKGGVLRFVNTWLSKEQNKG